MSAPLVYPVCQIKHNRVCLYPVFENITKKKKENVNSLNNLSSNNYKGEMTEFARKNMTKVLDNWASSLNSVNSKLLGHKSRKAIKMVMVTLTLPSEQVHSDKVIKRECLNKFLIYCNRNFGCSKYVWKAEFQENGNIHFHIIFDKYIHHLDVRALWNSCISKLGYIDAFAKKHGHNDPNSTDIHAVRDISKGFSYLLKYMTKSQCCRLEGGKVWGCSDNLNKLNAVVLEITSKVGDFLCELAVNERVKMIKTDNVTLFYGDMFKILKEQFKSIWNDYREQATLIWCRSFGMDIELDW